MKTSQVINISFTQKNKLKNWSGTCNEYTGDLLVEKERTKDSKLLALILTVLTSNISLFSTSL